MRNGGGNGNDEQCERDAESELWNRRADGPAQPRARLDRLLSSERICAARLHRSRPGIRNIYDRNEREQALREIARVTKPGGHVGIIDIRHSYAPTFERLGFTIVKKWMTFLFATPTRSTVVRKV